MAENLKPGPAIFKNIIENYHEPLIFSNIIDYWKNWDTEKWKNEFKNEKLPFRRGFQTKCGVSDL